MGMDGFVGMDNAKKTMKQGKAKNKKGIKKTMNHTVKKKQNTTPSKGNIKTPMTLIHGELNNDRPILHIQR